MSTDIDDLDAKHIGERIGASMDEIDISRRSLAKILGVTEDSVYKMLRGETVKRWVDLVKLARALRTSPNALLGFGPGDTRARLARLLDAAFQALGSSEAEARNAEEIFLELLDKPPNPRERVAEPDILRIELAALKRRSAAR